MFRQLIIKYLSPLIWKFFPSRKIEALQEFAVIEKDSGCQILWALELIDDPKLKALVFQHVLEEFFHAELFEGLSNHYSNRFIPRKVLPREILVDRNSSEMDIWEFFAYAHVGEDGVNSDFNYYALAKKIDKKIAAIFHRVSEDEGNHIYGTKDILFQLVKENKRIFYWLITKSKIKRTFKQLESSTAFIANSFLSLALSVVYFTLGIFSLKNIKTNFDELSSDDIVELIKEQQREL